MRKPSWEKSPGALATFLNRRKAVGKVDLWTITLKSGGVLRWSGGDRAFTVDGRVFERRPAIMRNTVKFTRGISVDYLQMTIMDAVGTTIGGRELGEYICNGGFDDAEVMLERAFWDADMPVDIIGTLIWFLGDVDDVDGDRHQATVKVVSALKRLDTMVPRDVYQSGCRNTVFDAQCGLSRSANTVTGASTGPSNSYRTSFPHDLSEPSGWFTLGEIKMTSGLNDGISRTVRSYSTSSFVALQPWPYPIAEGDTFSAVPGCDGKRATCINKFDNLFRFRAEPYIPVAETVT